MPHTVNSPREYNLGDLCRPETIPCASTHLNSRGVIGRPAGCRRPKPAADTSGEITMQALRGYLTTSTRDDEPSASVLAEWKKYESGGDVESGGAGQASSSTGSTPAKSAFMVGLAGARFMQETLSGGFSRAAAGVSESAATVSSSVSR